MHNSVHQLIIIILIIVHQIKLRIILLLYTIISNIFKDGIFTNYAGEKTFLIIRQAVLGRCAKYFFLDEPWVRKRSNKI